VDTASFLTAESGFAVTAQCSANACRTVVLHTSDAAQSWTVLEPLAVDLTPPANGAGPRGHVELRVIDDLHLLAVETRGTATGLQLSNDGGHTWTTPTLPGQPQPRTLSAVATHTGFWILAGSSAEGSEPLTLFRLDAGSSVASDVGSAASTGVLAAGPVTKDRAYVMDGSASLLVLDGLHRSQRALPAPCGVLTAGRDGTLILACQDGAAAGSGPKRAWMSADDGQTWKRIPDPPYASDLIELIQIAPSRLLLNTASGESSLTLTTDGGRSWNRTLTFGDGGTGISAVSFPDARNGFVVHGGPAHMSTVSGGGLEGQASVDSEGLFVTHDGGTTWTKVDISKAAQ
jgi:photosystem II stability/assembly factor-like uncharacterized protein